MNVMLKLTILTYNYIFIFIFAGVSIIKNISFYLLLSMLSLLLFAKSITILHYTYIAPQTAIKNCVNLDKPKLNCNGKCYIAKQIKATENSDKENNFHPVFPDQDYYFENTSYSHNIGLPNTIP